MSYELNALIATAELIAVVAAEVPVAEVVPLPQGLALIPMTDRLHDHLAQPSNAPDLGFKRFPGGFALRLTAWSKAAPIAYVEADRLPDAPAPSSFAGQRAAVWENGRITLGPLRAPATDPTAGAAVPAADQLSATDPLSAADPLSATDCPIARALRALGAQRGTEPDEIAAVGLIRLAREL